MKLILTLKLFLILNLIIPTTSAQASLDFNKTEYVYSTNHRDSLRLHVFESKSKKRNPDDTPAIIIFHGGGWSSGKSSWAFNLAQRFAEKGIKGVAVQYSLSDKQNLSPIDAMTDAKDAIIWVRKNAEKLNILSEKIAVYGWSAGGHLAAGTAVFPKYEQNSEISSIPNALILSSPALSVVNDNWFKKLLPENKKVIDFSPAENISGKLPPSIILVGKDDTVTPSSQAKLFYTNAIKHGSDSEIHIFKNVGHLFTPSNEPDNRQPKPDKKTVNKAFEHIDSFLMQHGYI